MIASVAKCLLLLFQGAKGDEKLAFECQPWATNRWREVLGLSPVRATADEDEDIMDLDDGPTSPHDACAADGFAFDPTALTTFSAARRQCITDPETVKSANGFMQRFWEQARKDIKRSKPFSYTFDSLPKDQGKGNDPIWPGFGEYRNLALAMVNRRDGVLERVDAIMARLGFLPTDRWKDDRDINRTLPERLKKDIYKISIPIDSTRLDDTGLQAEVARDIFGKQAVSARGIVFPSYQPTIKALLYRRYESHARKLRTTQKKSGEARAKLDWSLEKARASLAAEDLHNAAKDLVAWRRIALKSLEHDEPEFLSRDKMLKGLWEDVGFPAQAVGSKIASKPKGKNNKSILPTDQEMQLAYEYWLDEYCNGLGAIDDPDAYETPLFINRVHGLVDEDMDIGVEYFKDWTKEKLWESMGVPGATQFAFAEPGSPADGKRTSSKDPATPYWHQLVGVHRILENIFTSDIGERALPTLLLDDVGLGKTLQIIGVFSMIRHYYEQQELKSGKDAYRPHFAEVNRTPYLAGVEEIPNLPSIVISPRTLSNQWVEQWAKFTHHGAFSIVRYSVDQGPLEKFFTDPKGAYLKAAGPDRKRASSVIIVADLSAVAAEAKRCLEIPELSPDSKEGRLEEAKGDVPTFKKGVDTTGSLFAMKFRAAAVDECHNLRNSNHGQRGTQMLTSNSHVVIGATATLIFTSIWDALAQARIMRFGPVLGDAGVKLYERMSESMQDRAKDWNQNSAQFIEKAISRETTAAASEAGVTAGPLFEKLREQVQLKYQNPEQVKILESTHVTRNALKMLRKTLRPIMVRRTGDSVDNQGKPILGLPPVQRLTAWSPMQTEEHRTQQEINQEHQQRKKSSAKKGTEDSATIKWHNFLMSQKDAAVHVLIYQLKKLEEEKLKKQGVEKAEAKAAKSALGKSLAERITANWTESNINSKASTRMLKADEIVEHFWVGNPAPVVFNEDGTQDLTALVGEPWPCENPRKFLIYVAYHTHRDLLAKMFKIKKRGHVCYDGSMPIPKRQAAVDQFNNNPSCRIMIISNVGSAGLNLVAASVVIVLSNVWSGLEKDQIFGRVVRPGQKRDVLLYNIVAPGGIDLALLGYSDKKSVLSEQLLMSQAALERIYSDVTAPEEDFDDGVEAEQGDHTVVKATKVLARKRKQLDETDEDDLEGSNPGSPSKRSKFASSREDAPAQGRTKVIQARSSTVEPRPKKASANATHIPDLGRSASGKESPGIETHRAQLSTQPESESGVSRVPGGHGEVRGALFDNQGPVSSELTPTPTSASIRKPRTKFKPPPAVNAVPLGSGGQTASPPGALVPSVGPSSHQAQVPKLPTKTHTTVLPEAARIIEQNGKGSTSVLQAASTAPRPKRKFRPPPGQASLAHASGSSLNSHSLLAVEPDDMIPMEHCGPVSLEVKVTPASQTRDVTQAQGIGSIHLAVPLPSSTTQSCEAQPPKPPVIERNVVQALVGQGRGKATKADSQATGVEPTAGNITAPKRQFKPPPKAAEPSLPATCLSQIQPVQPPIPPHSPMASHGSPTPVSKPKMMSSVSGARTVKPPPKRQLGAAQPQNDMVRGMAGDTSELEGSDNSINKRMTQPEDPAVHSTAGGMSESEDLDQFTDEDMLERKHEFRLKVDAIKLAGPTVCTTSSLLAARHAFGLQVAGPSNTELVEQLRQETKKRGESQQHHRDERQTESRTQPHYAAAPGTAGGSAKLRDPGQSASESLLERKRKLRLQLEAITRAGPMVGTASSQPIIGRTPGLQDAGPAKRRLFEPLQQQTTERRESQQRLHDEQRTEPRTQPHYPTVPSTAGGTSELQASDPGGSPDERIEEGLHQLRLEAVAREREGPRVGTTSSQPTAGHALGSKDAGPVKKPLFERLRQEEKERRENQQRLLDEQLVTSQANAARSQKRARIESVPSQTEVTGQSRKVNRQPSGTANGQVSWLSARKKGASQSKVVRHPATVSSRDGEKINRGL